MNRYCSILSRSFAGFLALALVNLSVPMGGINALAPDPNSPRPAPEAPRPTPAASRPLTAKSMRQLQGKSGENPYFAGSNKWDVEYKGVNLTTGDFKTSATDLTFEGGYGIPVNVTRAYSSNNPDEGPIGKGWSLSVDIRNTAGGLIKGPSSPVRSVPSMFKERPSAQGDPRIPDANEPVEAVIATDAGGMEETIQKDADGILTTPSWDKNRNVSEYENVVDGGNIYQILVSNTVTTPEGTVYFYQKKGSYPYGTVPWNDPMATATPANVLKPVSVTDRHGNVTTYTYGATDVTFTKSNGTVTEKRLESIEMPNGHEITFTWGNGTNAPTNRIRTASDGVRTVTYGYTSGNLTSITTPAGLITTFGYATPNVPEEFEGTPGGACLTSITDPRGLTTTMSYEMRESYVLPYLVGMPGVKCMKIEQPNGVTVYFGISIDEGMSSGNPPGFIDFTERYGGATGTIINRGGLRYETGTTPPTLTIQMVDHETTPGSQAWAPGTISWSKTYDPNSQNLLSETYHNKEWENAVTTFLTNRRILPTSWLDQTITTTTIYNFMGNPLEKTVTDHTSPKSGQTPPSDHVTTVKYAYWGREKYYQQKAVKDQAGRYSFTDYFDHTATTGKKGQTYRVYDEKRTTFYLDTGITPPSSCPSGDYWKYQLKPSDTSTYTAEFDYDSKGRPIDVWKLQKTTTSPWTYVRTHTTYGADSSPTWGAATEVVEDYGSGKINRTTSTLSYDSIGRATQVQDASGKQFETTYDADGKIQTVYRIDTTPDELIVGYTYGTSGLENGVPTQVEDGLSGVAQTFAFTSSGGGKGQVASVTETNGADNYAVSYTYNSAGERETATYATDSGTTKWKYSDYIRVNDASNPTRVFQTLTKLDGAGDPTSEQFHYAYDFRGRLRNATFAMTPQSGQTGYSTSYPADTRGRAYYSYDPAGRITDIEHYWDDWGGSAYTSTPILGNHCDYELSGSNRGLKTASGFYVNSSGSWTLDRTEYYGYDDNLDTLINADYNDGLTNETPSWSYDAAGNRNDVTAVDNLNRATTIGGVSRTYDILGNTLTIGSSKTMTWDVVNRMTQLAISGGAIWSYQYRADGLRVKKSDGTMDSFFYYDGQMPIETMEDDGTNTVVTRNGVGPRGIDRIERVNSSGTIVGYPIYDAHGSMVATLSKSSGNYAVNDQRSYDAWGSVRSGNTTGDPKSRYGARIGHTQDDESGLIYMRARYYDVSAGRFISEDGERDGYNWIIYTSNNPINAIDIDGHFTFYDVLCSALLSAALSAGFTFGQQLVRGGWQAVNLQAIIYSAFSGFVSGLVFGVGAQFLAKGAVFFDSKLLGNIAGFCEQMSCLGSSKSLGLRVLGAFGAGTALGAGISAGSPAGAVAMVIGRSLQCMLLLAAMDLE